MNKRQYSTEGRRGILKVLDDAGYVEVPEFEGAKRGYFCRTCTKMSPAIVQVPDGFIGHYCRGLQVPVAPHGCCNYWVYSPPGTRVLS